MFEGLLTMFIEEFVIEEFVVEGMKGLFRRAQSNRIRVLKAIAWNFWQLHP